MVKARGNPAGDADQARLAVRAAGGDVKAFEELYRLNVGRVYALCLRMSGDPGLADELVQEAFLRAVRDRAYTPEVTAVEGLAALKCAQKIVDRVRKHEDWEMQI